MGVFSFINGMKIICLENIGLISINSLVFLINIGLYIFLLKDNVIVDIILIDFFDGLDGLVNFDQIFFFWICICDNVWWWLKFVKKGIIIYGVVICNFFVDVVGM